ncbi:MAG: (2Fe-2S) ferredoxin domain-containing protein [Rhodospirillales bacterium]
MSDDSGDLRPFFDRHVFMCMNERPEGHERGSCARKGSVQLRNYIKARAKELGLETTRINEAGCLDRCELGPTMVIYPEGIWYRCETQEDADEILAEHLQNGRPVKRLMLHPDDR